jgi:hypothetical protein
LTNARITLLIAVIDELTASEVAMYNKSILFAVCVLSFVSFVFSQTDWQEFFPLHIGDYWVYREVAPWPDIYTLRVVGRDTLENGQVYAKIQCYYRDSYSYFFRRVDNLGDVYDYVFNKKERLLFKLNVDVGDTWPDPDIGGYWEVVEKSDYIADNDTLTYLRIESFENMAFTSYSIWEKIGVVHIGFEGGNLSLLGAFINGRIAAGDTVITKVSSKQDKIAPDEASLNQNYPNPFNQFTRISYKIRNRGAVNLAIYDMGGRAVKQLVNSEQPAGESTVTWDGTDDNDASVVTGMYLIRLQADDLNMTRKILYLK